MPIFSSRTSACFGWQTHCIITSIFLLGWHSRLYSSVLHLLLAVMPAMFHLASILLFEEVVILRPWRRICAQPEHTQKTTPSMYPISRDGRTSLPTGSSRHPSVLCRTVPTKPRREKRTIPNKQEGAGSMCACSTCPKHERFVFCRPTPAGWLQGGQTGR